MELRYQKERLAIARLVVGLTRIIAKFYFPGMSPIDTMELTLVVCAVMVGHIEGRPQTVSKLARITGMSRSTVQRRLAYLITTGYVERHDGVYGVGEVRVDPPGIEQVLERIAALVLATAKELPKLTHLP